MQIRLFQGFDRKLLLRLLLSTGFFVVSLIALWLILGNIFTAGTNRKLVQLQTEIIDRYPPTEDNASAKEIKRLAVKLGIEPLMEIPDRQPPFSPTKDDKEAFSKIQQQLIDYVKTQSSKSSDEIDAPPAELKAYFDRQTKNISAIRNYILANEAPKWELYNLKEVVKDPIQFPLPSWVGFVNLNRILIYDALVQNNLGQTQLALDNLEAVTKLNQNLYDRPDIISQLVATMNFRERSGALRKIDRLTPGWEKKLLMPDARQSLLNSMEIENRFLTVTIRDYPITVWSSNGSFSLDSPFAQIDKTLLRPYRIFVAADFIEKQQAMLEELPKQDICTLNLDRFIADNKFNSARWNIFTGDITKSLIENGWFGLAKRDIAWELSQKIQQVKELALRSDRPPETIPGIERSPICPDLSWKYQKTSDGSMSISLENPPDWLNSKQGDLPIKYSFKMEDLN
jgi:hypothetical protein